MMIEFSTVNHDFVIKDNLNHDAKGTVLKTELFGTTLKKTCLFSDPIC